MVIALVPEHVVVGEDQQGRAEQRSLAGDVGARHVVGDPRVRGRDGVVLTGQVDDVDGPVPHVGPLDRVLAGEVHPDVQGLGVGEGGADGVLDAREIDHAGDLHQQGDDEVSSVAEDVLRRPDLGLGSGERQRVGVDDPEHERRLT